MPPNSHSPPGPEADPPWAQLIPASQIEALRRGSEVLKRAGVDHLLGGAFAIARHVGRWRGTKDIDFFIRPADRERAIAAILAAGLEDYFDQCAYDRSWIFRAYRDDALIDLIWTVPNHAAVVDDRWFQFAARVAVNGSDYGVVPLEELIWIKLFVMQRDRCDWPDVINLLRGNAAQLNWEHLFARLAMHEPLLVGVFQVLEWIAPEAIAAVPAWVQERLHVGRRSLAFSGNGAGSEAKRAALLDSRPWYASTLSAEERMEP